MSSRRAAAAQFQRVRRSTASMYSRSHCALNSRRGRIGQARGEQQRARSRAAAVGSKKPEGSWSGVTGSRAEDHQPLADVAQLAHVARPGVALQVADRPRDRPAAAAPGAGGRTARGSGEQQRHVLPPLAQRRHLDRQVGEAEVEVLAEAAVARPPPPGRGGSRRAPARPPARSRVSPIRRTRPSSSTRSSRDCSGQLHVADLVEEQRAAVRLLEQAGLGGLGVGERAARVAEQLVFDEVRRDGRAVDLDERALAARGSAGGARSPPAPCPCRSRRGSARAPSVGAACAIRCAQRLDRPASCRGSPARPEVAPRARRPRAAAPRCSRRCGSIAAAARG